MDANSIRDLLAGISPEELERLKGVAQSLLQNGAAPAPAGGQPKNEGGGGVAGVFGDDVTKALAAVAGQLGREDERTRFLEALMPLLSETRRQRAKEAAQFLRLMDALPLLKGLL